MSIIHGHSSHHAKAIEVYHKRLILYGCGDFLNDYEGIRGYEEYRSDLALMYFADIEPTTGNLAALEIIPLQIRNFRLNRPSRQDSRMDATDAPAGMSAVRDRHRARSRRPARPFRFDVRPLQDSARRRSALIQVKALRRFRRLNNLPLCGGKIGETRQ